MVVMALLEHYFEYISSPAVLLAILTIVGPIYLEIFRKWRLTPTSSSSGVPGCFRLGLSKKSNLDDQYEIHSSGDSNEDRTPHVKALFTYPVKSCRGIELAASQVGPTGLRYDRLFTFAQLISSPDSSHIGTATKKVDEISKDWSHQWRFITQREFPKLALIQTELWVPRPVTSAKTGPHSKEGKLKWRSNGGCLILRFPHEPAYNLFGLRTETVTIRLPLSPTEQHIIEKRYKSEMLSIWKDVTSAINVTTEIPPDDLRKLKSFLGVSNPLGLFRVDDKNRRVVKRSLPKDRADERYFVGFADAFPFHLLNLASVRAQDQELPVKERLKGSLDVRRFRANIYTNGPPAYHEDSWKRIAVGKCIKTRGLAQSNGSTNRSHTANSNSGEAVEIDAEYHVACRTARCKLPNVDQNTGIRDANEPLTTLNRTRKVDKGAYPHPCLGMQMIPLFEQGILRVGDEINVLERGEHVYEKMFA